MFVDLERRFAGPRPELPEEPRLTNGNIAVLIVIGLIAWCSFFTGAMRDVYGLNAMGYYMLGVASILLGAASYLIALWYAELKHRLF